MVIFQRNKYRCWSSSCIIFLVLATTALLPQISRAFHLHPIEDIVEDAYLGVWFQVYASASVKYTFELGGNCVTARYGRTEQAGTIQVQNVVRPCTTLNDGSIPFGDLLFTIAINGWAVQDSVTDGRLSVNLPNIPGLPFGIGAIGIDEAVYTSPGNYWIIELGPQNPLNDNKYDYSIVTNNEDGDQLYVLARNVTEFYEKYDAQVLESLEEFGFTRPFNRPRRTNQENCNYELYKFEDDFPF